MLTLSPQSQDLAGQLTGTEDCLLSSFLSFYVNSKDCLNSARAVRHSLRTAHQLSILVVASGKAQRGQCVRALLAAVE